MLAAEMPEAELQKYPPGFRPRRGLNWFIIGLMYASYYMCRYNFRFATPGMVEEFGFSTLQITGMLSAWSIAYGTGQLVNGLLTDRIGGKIAMLIGAAGTIAVNLVFGFASFAGTFTTFAAIWLFNGYVQSFGAPGMIKMNAAWFRRTERGTFAGIFGFMIQMGQFAINNLAPIILAGFTIGIWIGGEERLALSLPHPAAHRRRGRDPARHFRQEHAGRSRLSRLDRDRPRRGGYQQPRQHAGILHHHFYSSADLVLRDRLRLHRRGPQQLGSAHDSLFSRSAKTQHGRQARGGPLDGESHAARRRARFSQRRDDFR